MEGEWIMKNYIVTLQVSCGGQYNLEKYVIPVENGESIETATEAAMEELGFCDRWEVLAAEEVDTGYMIAFQAARNLYHSKTGLTVEEGFISGKFTTASAILYEIAELDRLEKK